MSFKWKHALPSALCIGMWVVVGWVNRYPLASLHHKWVQWSESYSHGYFIVCISLFYIFRSASEYKNAPSVYLSKPAILIISFLNCCGWMLAHFTQLEILQQLLLPVSMWLVIALVFSRTVLFKATFPLLLLFLAIPIWDILVPSLQSMTVIVSRNLVALFGIAAFVDGNSFSLPFGTIVVAGSCSGLAYLLMALSLSGVWSLLNQVSLADTLKAVALLVVLSLIGNWMRVTSLILIAYHSEMRSELVYDHGMFGWYIFAVVFILFLLITRNRFIFSESPTGYPTGYLTRESNVKASLFGRAAPALFVLLSFILPAKFVVARTEVEEPSIELTPCFPVAFRGFDRLTCETIVQESQVWDKLVLYYDDQWQGKELINGQNRVWEADYAIRSDDGMVQKVELTNNSVPFELKWYFEINGHQTTDKVMGKLYQALVWRRTEKPPALVVLSRKI